MGHKCGQEKKLLSRPLASPKVKLEVRFHSSLGAFSLAEDPKRRPQPPPICDAWLMAAKYVHRMHLHAPLSTRIPDLLAANYVYRKHLTPSLSLSLLHSKLSFIHLSPSPHILPNSPHLSSLHLTLEEKERTRGSVAKHMPKAVKEIIHWK